MTTKSRMHHHSGGDDAYSAKSHQQTESFSPATEFPAPQISINDCALIGNHVVLCFNADGVCYSASDNVNRVLGYSPQQLIGQPIEFFEANVEPTRYESAEFNVIPYGQLRAKLLHVHKSGEPLEFVFETNDANGVVRGMSSRAIRINSEQFDQPTVLLASYELQSTTVFAHHPRTNTKSSESEILLTQTTQNSIHKLNNLLMAMSCCCQIFEAERQTSSNLGDFSVLIEHTIAEVKALAKACDTPRTNRIS